MAPHLKAFIEDQLIHIRPFFNEAIVLMPAPYFYSIALRLPYIERYFRYLELMMQSRNELAKEYMMISPKFFTLPIEPIRKRNYYLVAKSCIKKLSRTVENFDLIHAHFLELGAVGTILKNQYDEPLIVTLHGGDVYYLPFKDSWYNSLTRFVLTEADQVITVCKFNAEKLLSLGVSSKKLHVIPNGYNETIFHPIPLCEARNRLSLPLNRKILLSVGDLIQVKGHSYLIDAMRFIMKRWDDAILIIVGSGPLKESLQKKIMRLGLSEKVLLVGSKKHEETSIWMNASDIFILPSLKEGFPTVIPEAMACGKPVVATNVGGIPEAITHNDLGILVNPRDSEELASAMLEALERKWNPEVILKHAEKYSWSNLAEQIVSVYQKALSN
jgi:glycosyltransferase involved in cell wall biosynthesis